MSDPINHPDHYECNRFTCEPKDLTKWLVHPLASAVEYILRAPYKGTEEQDLKKAVWWLRELNKSPDLWVDREFGRVVSLVDDDNPKAFEVYTCMAAMCLKNRYIDKLFRFRGKIGYPSRTIVQIVIEDIEKEQAKGEEDE